MHEPWASMPAQFWTDLEAVTVVLRFISAFASALFSVGIGVRRVRRWLRPERARSRVRRRQARRMARRSSGSRH